MSNTSDQIVAAAIEKVCAVVEAKFPAEDAMPISVFMKRYYRDMSADDLIETPAEDLYGAALSHWNFAGQRDVGSAKIHVYNPQPEQHGWQSSRTIIDIVIDDKPFLVDSLSMALDARGLSRFLLLHPILKVKRDAKGNLLSLCEDDATGKQVTVESWLHFEVARQTERSTIEHIRRELASVLENVKTAVDDWRLMCERLNAILDDLDKDSLDNPEDAAFIKWIRDDNFTLLGYREYDLVTESGQDVLRSVPDSGLGILRNPGTSDVSTSFGNIYDFTKKPHKSERLIVTKSNKRSPVHRPAYLDHISVNRFDEKGQMIGEQRLVGLYTSAAYIRSVREIPLLRQKVNQTLQRAKFTERGHANKALLHILETFPRDELFTIDEDTLFETTMGILQLQERQQLRVFVHRERYGRAYSCLVYFPREGYSTHTRDATQAILEETFQAEIANFSVQMSESTLARLYFLLRVSPQNEVQYDIKALEARLHEVTRTWNDDLEDAILEYFGEEERGMRLWRCYGKAFHASYQENYTARVAVRDIQKMESLGDDSDALAMTLYKPLESSVDHIRFKLFHPSNPVSLSDALPMLENMGLTVGQESPNLVERENALPVWIHDFSMVHREGVELDIDDVQLLFQEAFARIWRGEVENDGFNRLVLRAHLSWQEIVILRGYAKYMRQVGTTYSQDYMAATLVAHPNIVRQLIDLFHTRFHPQKANDKAANDLVEQIISALDDVVALDQDRILRNFLSMIQATLRTNYYQTDDTGQAKPYLSLKFDPQHVPMMPEPRPQFEVFVYSPRVEGIHLRGGPVARGGLRWSDRREDFRTEVLGLMKAQMVKNAVIVPVGSKGGFVPKQLSPSLSRDAAIEEAKACYRLFICGLLDVTDNIVDGAIIPPQQVVRHDKDDPYLVVAADKGTATFSDIANDIAIEYGFWLGDAFASGGSIGYDHKKMGITARGAWESVKRHFRQKGINTQTTPFTVVGIGDMSGDVFGNGMLLSEHIMLVGAFNHLHIFLDPDPDPEKSFEERKRLFSLPQSSWEDYDVSLISKGGGIYSRAAKSISLSPEVRKALQVENKHLTPNELIQAILKAPVELLWNGGIGTYVKASSEHHDDVGDRATDTVRVNANEMRCKVVVEGGNLGLTQLGRIEFAKHGGCIQTDAIDNSAGVDCSDHEVNIKILLNQVTSTGDLTEKHRNQLLADMTDEVGKLVIRSNYLQTQELSLAAFQPDEMLDMQARLIDKLELDGELVREIEFLPDSAEIRERKDMQQGLTLPETSVLVGYVKLTIYKQLLQSDLQDAAYFKKELINYFPKPLQERYSDIVSQHRLAREIVCTIVTNEIVNRSGSTFMFRLGEETGAQPADIARAFAVATTVFDQRSIWAEIEALDNLVPASVQIEMLLEGRKLVEGAARWFVRNLPQPLDIDATIQYFSKGVSELTESLTDHIAPASQAIISAKALEWREVGVPEKLALAVAGFDELLSALDIVEVSRFRDVDVYEVSDIYFTLGGQFNLHWLRDQISALSRNDRWQSLGCDALRDDLYAQQRAMTADVLKRESHGGSPTDRIGEWLRTHALGAERCERILSDLRQKEHADFVMLSVALREIRQLSHLSAPEVSIASRDS